MGEIQSKLKRLRFLQSLLIVIVLLIFFFAEMSHRPVVGRWTLLHSVGAALSLWAILEGLYIRRRWMPRYAELFAQGTLSRKSLDRWQATHVFGLGMAESVALWGFVVRLVQRGTFGQALLFYITGMFFLLLWTPRMPEQ